MRATLVSSTHSYTATTTYTAVVHTRAHVCVLRLAGIRRQYLYRLIVHAYYYQYTTVGSTGTVSPCSTYCVLHGSYCHSTVTVRH